jgi:hypothetical protein
MLKRFASKGSGLKKNLKKPGGLLIGISHWTVEINV